MSKTTILGLTFIRSSSILGAERETMMKIETAKIRLRNAAYRFLRGLDERYSFDRKLWNILRGIWLDNGVEAVNSFVVDTALMVGAYGECQDIPVVRTDFTDADFEGSERH